MARSTWQVMLIKNIYTLWRRKRFLPFTIRVTGIITMKYNVKRIKIYGLKKKNQKIIIRK